MPPAPFPALREYVVAGRFARWMEARGWWAVTLPMPFVTLVLYWTQARPQSRVHEVCGRFIQARDAGLWRWWTRYWWDLCTVGYEQSRYERDAYDIETRFLAGRIPVPWLTR